MDGVYAHFGLSHAPFDGGMTPELFYTSPLHEEALATVQYAVRANKACVVVIGESGVGKTMIGRLASKSFSPTRPLIWLHGLGQPDNGTEITAIGPRGGQPNCPTTMLLGEWVRQYARRHGAPRVIIDDAEHLRAHNWDDVISLLAQEVHYSDPINLVLIGSEKLRDRLSQPDLIRVRRRVFRICPLKTLTEEQVFEYLQQRLAAAGGDVASVFTEDAVRRVAQLTRGDPSLVNQLCDNALIEACGAERTQVTTEDVANAVYAMLGVTDPATDLPRLPKAQRELLAAPADVSDVGELSSVYDDLDFEEEDDTDFSAAAADFAQRLNTLQTRLQSAIENLRRGRMASYARMSAATAKVVPSEPVADEPIEEDVLIGDSVDDEDVV